MNGAQAHEDPVSAETVTTVDGISALGECYEDLLTVTRNRLPFALHEWHVAWCRNFLNCDSKVRDELLFCVLRNAKGRCVALVPLIINRRKVGPFDIVSLNLLGADPAITELRAPLIEAGYESATAHAVRNLLSGIGHWDWIHWSGISPEFAAALGGDAELEWLPPLADFVLDMAPTWEEFRGRLKRNIRESLRHCYNSLKRDHHEFELTVIQDPAHIREGIDRFLALHLMRANLQSGEVHPNRFASAVSRSFLYEVCERLAARGTVRLFQLKINSQVVAMRVGFLVGDSLYLYYSGFDPAWARYSVMTTTMAEAIKYAIAHGLKTVNLSPTRDIAKTRWGPRQIDYRSAYQLSGTLRSRFARLVYQQARSGPASRLLRRLISAHRDWH